MRYLIFVVLLWAVLAFARAENCAKCTSGSTEHGDLKFTWIQTDDVLTLKFSGMGKMISTLEIPNCFPASAGWIYRQSQDPEVLPWQIGALFRIEVPIVEMLSKGMSLPTELDRLFPIGFQLFSDGSCKFSMFTFMGEHADMLEQGYQETELTSTFFVKPHVVVVVGKSYSKVMFSKI